MKRDMALVEAIMFTLEDYFQAKKTCNYANLEVAGYPKELVTWHMKFMAPKFFLVDPRSEYYLTGFSWDGHNWLDEHRTRTVVAGSL